MPSLGRARGVATMTLDAARSMLAGLGGDGRVTLDVTSVPYVAILSLDNPKRANALSCGMMLQLSDAIDALSNWTDGRGLIVAGVGNTFCSGADLRGSDNFLHKDSGAAMNAVMVDATSRLAALPLVSVAAIQGAAVGGGAELATACDFRVMEREATIQFVHAARGLVPGWGGITRLVELCGRRQALYLLATTMKVEASLASSLHLTDEIVAATEEVPLVQSALAFLRPILHLDTEDTTTEVLRHIKGAVHGVAVEAQRGVQYQIESDVFQTRWGDHQHLSFMKRWSQPTSTP